MTAGPSKRARQPREPDWLTVEEAQRTVLSRIQQIGVEDVPITEALGRVLATDVESTLVHPPWDNSAMDGYAVRSKDVADVSRERPAVLEVVEEVQAGDFPTRAVAPGEAIKVMTGAPVPEGAEGVTRIEYTEPGPRPGGSPRSRCTGGPASVYSPRATNWPTSTSWTWCAMAVAS
jgi:molybdopterin molybdotransferase